MTYQKRSVTKKLFHQISQSISMTIVTRRRQKVDCVLVYLDRALAVWRVTRGLEVPNNTSIEEIYWNLRC